MNVCSEFDHFQVRTKQREKRFILSSILNYLLDPSWPQSVEQEEEARNVWDQWEWSIKIKHVLGLIGFSSPCLSFLICNIWQCEHLSGRRAERIKGASTAAPGAGNSLRKCSCLLIITIILLISSSPPSPPLLYLCVEDWTQGFCTQLQSPAHFIFYFEAELW